MSSLRFGLQQLRCVRQLSKAQAQKPQWTATLVHRRNLTTDDKDIAQLKAEFADEATTLPFTSEPKFDESEVAATGIRPPPQKPFKGIKNVRAIPVSPSYFTRSPYFFDAYSKITALFQKYQHLPIVPPERVPAQLWKGAKDFKAAVGEPIKGAPYGRTLKMVKHLHKIEPQLMPPEVQAALEEFKRGIDPYSNIPNVPKLDRFGRALGVGRRKTATARAWVVEGTGEVQINGKPLSEVFGRVHDRESALWALQSTERVDKYNVWALVGGGGTTGQAEALTLAIAKAMLTHEPALKPALRQAGCITRDPRRVERKKHGHVKARKSPAWVKR